MCIYIFELQARKQVRWCGAHSAWVTASDDNTLRMWQGVDGLPLMKDEALRAQGY